MFTLQAEPRSIALKAKHLRKKGLIPGCLYGGDIDKSLLLQITESEVKKLLKFKVKGGKVLLDVEGERINALLREIGRNSVNGQIEHISFQKLNSNELVTSTAKIELINKEKMPLYIQQVLFDTPYRTIASKLIEKIEIDLDGMHAGDCIKVKDLDIAKDDDIELLIDSDSLVVSLIENKRPIDMVTSCK